MHKFNRDSKRGKLRAYFPSLDSSFRRVARFRNTAIFWDPLVSRPVNKLSGAKIGNPVKRNLTFPSCIEDKCLYIISMGFEWDDENKAQENYRKHGVRFPEAEAVLDDPYGIILTDNESDPNEQRFVMLGMGELGRLLVVVYTYRGENIRIISARPAESHERKEYEAQL